MNLEALLADAAAAALSPGRAGCRGSGRAAFAARRLPVRRGAAAGPGRCGRAPRDIAADVLARADLAGVATAEVSGPGFLNLTVDDALLAAAADEPAGRRAARRAGGRSAAADRHRLLGAEHRQGDDRRAPALDGDRGRAGPDAGVARATTWSGPTTWATGARRSGCSSSTCSSTGDAGAIGDLTAFYQAARARVRRRRGLPDPVAAAGRRAAGRRRADAGAVAAAGRRCRSGTCWRRTHRLGVTLGRGRLRRGELLPRPARVGGGRADGEGPADRERRRAVRVPGRLHRPGRRAAPADRAQERRRFRVRGHGPRRAPVPGPGPGRRPGCSTSSAHRSGPTSRWCSRWRARRRLAARTG